MNHLIGEAGTTSDMRKGSEKTLGEILEDTVATEINGNHTAEQDTGYDFSAVKSVLDYLDLYITFPTHCSSYYAPERWAEICNIIDVVNIAPCYRSCSTFLCGYI